MHTVGPPYPWIFQLQIKNCFQSIVCWICEWETKGYEGLTVYLLKIIHIQVDLYSSNPCSRVSCIFTTVIPCFETVVLQNKTSNWEPSLLCSSSNNKTSLIPPFSTWLCPISLSDWALWLHHLQLRGFYRHSLTFIRVHHSLIVTIA